MKDKLIADSYEHEESTDDILKNLNSILDEYDKDEEDSVETTLERAKKIIERDRSKETFLICKGK